MNDIAKGKSTVAEDLVTLYLRLNGYLTTGFILHSPQKGNIQTELDCVAVRFPNSEEVANLPEYRNLNECKALVRRVANELKIKSPLHPD